MESLGSSYLSNSGTGSFIPSFPVKEDTQKSGEWVDSEDSGEIEALHAVDDKGKLEEAVGIYDPFAASNSDIMRHVPRSIKTTSLDVDLLVNELNKPGHCLILENNSLVVRMPDSGVKTFGEKALGVLKRISSPQITQEVKGTTSKAMIKLLSYIEKMPLDVRHGVLKRLQETTAFSEATAKGELQGMLVGKYFNVLNAGESLLIVEVIGGLINEIDDGDVRLQAMSGEWQESKCVLCQSFMQDSPAITKAFDAKQKKATGNDVKPQNLAYRQLDTPYSTNWMNTVDAQFGRTYKVLGGPFHEDVGDIRQFAELELVKDGKVQRITSNWKSHISVHPQDLEKAWNLVMPILAEYGIEHCKVSRLSALERTVHFAYEENAGSEEGIARAEQAEGLAARVVQGMQITIYLNDTPRLSPQQEQKIRSHGEDSQAQHNERFIQTRNHYTQVFTKIEKVLAGNKIRSGRMDPDTDVVMDEYSSCRYHGNYDKKYDSDRTQNPNPESKPLPYRMSARVMPRRVSLEEGSALLTLRSNTMSDGSDKKVQKKIDLDE